MFKIYISKLLLEALVEYSTIISLKYNIELSELKTLYFNFIIDGYKEDIYFERVLKERFNDFFNYYFLVHEKNRKYNLKIRKPNFPEDISENIIKFIIRKFDDDLSCHWKGGKDLYSYKGIIECKTFTTDGPISFSPSSIWNFIYFLDATKLHEKHFKLYKCSISNSTDDWKNIKVNLNETFCLHSKQGRRPRISWSKLFPQIKTNIIFDGKFDEIF
jgi:hypothetical protein